MDKNWQTRFEIPHKGRPLLFRVAWAGPAKVAVAYWIIVLLVFFGMQLAGFDMIADGAIPAAALTVPWSLLLIAAASSLSPAAAQVLLRPFTSTVGSFVIFVVVGGGLNAILIFALLSRIGRRKHLKQLSTDAICGDGPRQSL